MAEGARGGKGALFPRMRTYGTPVPAGRRLAAIVSGESLLRLLLSFVLAVALWLYVSAKQDPTVAWDFAEPIPVAIQGLQQGLTVTNDPATIRLRIRVDNRNIPVSTASFHAFVDLSHLGPGIYNNLPVHVASDPGIHVVRTTPSHVFVAVERLAVRHVPVHWQMFSPPPSGYTVGTISVDPNTVTVSGPASAVAQVYDARVYIDLSQVRYSIDGFYKPSPETSQGTGISSAGHVSVDPSQIHVNVPVHALTGYKSLPVLAPIEGQPRAGVGVVGLSVQPAEITAYGPPGALAGLQSVQSEALSLSRHGAGTVTRSLRVKLPSSVRSHTHWVRVTAKLAPVSASSSIPIGITPRNLVPGLVARTAPASVLVTIVGPSSALKGAAGRMSATVDMAGYGIGTYRVQPAVHVPRGLKVVGVYPSLVGVVVRAAG